MTAINLEKSIISLIDEHILHIHLKSNQEINLDDAQQVLAAMGSIGEGKKLPVFIDAGEFVSIDDSVRSFSASKVGNIYTIADAIAVENIAQKLLANFYLKNDHPDVPTKIFNNKQEALGWLRQFIKN
jgi:hypothetical protein